MKSISQKEKAEKLHQLHQLGKMLVLPNIWDPLGALLLESLGYPAVATASASIAFTNGYYDGENIPFEELVILLKKIATGVKVPVTADIESGYAENDTQLQHNVKLLINAGIVGINIEDTDNKTNNLLSIESQCHKIKLIRKTAEEMGIPLFINARTDVYLHKNNLSSDSSRFKEILKRGDAYKEAGANCLFPVLLKQEEEIKKLIDQVRIPVNILTVPGIPDLKTLSNIGVSRVSLGPSFLKIAIKAMKEMALKLKSEEGLTELTRNEITTDYLENLIYNDH